LRTREKYTMKRNLAREYAGGRTRAARTSALPHARSHLRIAPKPGGSGTTTLSHVNEMNIMMADIWRTAKAIKQAGCRDVLMIYTAEFVRFIVTIKFLQRR